MIYKQHKIQLSIKKISYAKWILFLIIRGPRLLCFIALLYDIIVEKAFSVFQLVGWLLVLVFNATLTAKVGG